MDYLPPCITSPGIAAVVHRRLNELYFAHLLEALHSSASGIGASFTTTSEKEDSISNEILEYLAFCVAFSREGYLWPKKEVLRGLWGKSELTVREAGKLAVAKHTLHLSLLSPCILLILPRSGQAMTSLPAVHLPTTPF